jgi:hypothetical protein
MIGGAYYVTKLLTKHCCFTAANIQNAFEITSAKIHSKTRVDTQLAGEIIGDAYEDSTRMFIDLLADAESKFSLRSTNNHLRKNF